MHNKVVFIVGPTGVGKSNLAIELASRFNGDLISADSIQVYKGLDIISGKDLPQGYKLQDGYFTRDSSPSIYLLDVLEPTIPFDVSQFYKLATKSIDEILKKGKTPIVVGGTGLYIQTLLYGLKDTVSPNIRLREKLEKLNLNELQTKLKKVNPRIFNEMNESDIKNKRRLIRAIEVGRQKTVDNSRNQNTEFENFVIGLRCEREALKQRIDIRVEERIKNGAIEEAKKLFKNYDRLAQQVKDANGYKQIFSYLKNELTLEEAILSWKISENKHAKNQMTWFRKYGNVEWFDIEKENFEKRIENRVDQYLKS